MEPNKELPEKFSGDCALLQDLLRRLKELQGDKVEYLANGDIRTGMANASELTLYSRPHGLPGVSPVYYGDIYWRIRQFCRHEYINEKCAQALYEELNKAINEMEQEKREPNMNYTTLEQSRKLIELGIDPKTADLWLTEFQPLKSVGWNLSEPDGEKTVSVSFYKPEPIAQASYKYTPCWSLSALMDLIPHTSQLVKDGTYFYEWSSILRDEVDYTSPESDNPIDAAYDMVCWLLKNGYIKKEE